MKALIPAAGLGTRFLPATKAQPKEMLLVVDRPAIQYVVEEGLASAADEVVIINSHSKKIIEDHFSPDPELVALLRERGKNAYADEVERVGNMNVSYVYQDEALGLGHAVRCAASCRALCRRKDGWRSVLCVARRRARAQQRDAAAYAGNI